MEYIPPEVSQENHNVSKRHPLSEVAWLFGGLCALLLAAYLILGLLVDVVVPYVPAKTESAIGRIFEPLYSSELNDAQSQKLQSLVTALAGQLQEGPPESLRVHVIPHAQVNALAIPGGDIVVFSELLEAAESENEVAMVLGHEIGHLVHRHSLRSLGRSLVLITLSDLIFGQQNAVSRIMTPGLNSLQMKFSQSQETDADEVGLQLLNKHYGHAAGATDFFQRMAQESSESRLTYYFATHPHPDLRVQHLKTLIRQQDLSTQDKAAWWWKKE